MAGPITVAGFTGSAQAPDPRLLAESVGVSVVDARPGTGDLRPLKNALAVASVPSGTQRLTIYREGADAPSDTAYWFQWTTEVSVSRGFDGNDSTERIYYTGNGSPKWSNNAIGISGGPPYPQAERELAVPAPITPPTTAINVDGTGTQGYVFYVQTFVNDLGWESAPSPPSAALLVHTGATVNLTSLEAAPAGNYGITLRRIYVTTVGTAANGAFSFLREIAVGLTSTADDNRARGETIKTIGWLVPPTTAKQLRSLWNEMFAAIDGKNIIFCEPGFPYAWPVKYDRPIVHTPVALAKWEQNLLVLTSGSPVLLQGQDPGSMIEVPFTVGFPCASSRSVVEFDHGVVWASRDGLAYSGSQRLITAGVLTPAQWKALVPTTMVAARWQDFYICSYNDGSGLKAFLFDPLQPHLGITYLSAGFNAAYYDSVAQELYILVGTSIQKFAGDTTLKTAVFTSKKFQQTRPRDFSVAKVVATTYPVTLKVWADGVLRVNRSVADGKAFLLPAGNPAEEWQIELDATGNVEAARLATNIDDLKGL